MGRRFVTIIARRVEQHELFEKPSERAPQPAVFVETVHSVSQAPVSASAPAPAPAVLNDGCTVGDTSAVLVLLGPIGRVRVINHWATWCDPCVEELPLLAELHKRLAAKADFHGVSWDLFEGGSPQGGARHVADFARAHGISYDSVLVNSSPDAFFEALEMDFRQIPQTWVLDAQGSVIHRVEGILDRAGADEIAALVGSLTD
jgi:thiol-disulfide isomerase/thioredoxin